MLRPAVSDQRSAISGLEIEIRNLALRLRRELSADLLRLLIPLLDQEGARGWSSQRSAASSGGGSRTAPTKTCVNVARSKLNAANRCRELREWWMRREAKAD